MMKLFLLILTSYFSNLQANEGVTRLATCLAIEEEQFHINRVRGPEVMVTKELLELFATVKDLELKNNLYSQVCLPNVQNKGLQLLKIILTYRKEAFSSKTDDFIYQGFQNNFLDNLITTSGQLFFNYLSSIQQQMPIADCLRLEIPQLKKIQDRFKVLEGDVEFDFLLKKQEANQVFRKLSQIEKIKKRCIARKEKEIQRLKTSSSSGQS